MFLIIQWLIWYGVISDGNVHAKVLSIWATEPWIASSSVWGIFLFLHKEGG